jgi:hypothetical protein
MGAVAHNRNLRYSRGRHQEDHGEKPAQGKLAREIICQKKKKKKEKNHTKHWSKPGKIQAWWSCQYTVWMK